jgi:hypothetical protein
VKFKQDCGKNAADPESQLVQVINHLDPLGFHRPGCLFYNLPYINFPPDFGHTHLPQIKIIRFQETEQAAARGIAPQIAMQVSFSGLTVWI